jgi:hypothetical protein
MREYDSSNVPDQATLSLHLGLGFRQADWAFAFFPLTALLEEFDALESLKNRTLSAGAAGEFE